MAFFWIQQGRTSFQEGLALAVFSASSLTVVALLEAGRRNRIGRRRADTALAVREHRSRIMLDTIQEAYALLEAIPGDPTDFRILEVNGAFAALLGPPTGPLEGRTLRSLEAEPGWLEACDRISGQGDGLHQDLFSSRLGRWFHIHAFRPDPGLVGLLLLDITAAKRADQARFQVIFEHASLAIAWHDRDGLTLQANPAFLAMLGYAPEELPRLYIRDYLHPEEAPKVFAQRKALVDGNLEVLRQETRWIRKTGETLWVSIHVRPVHDPDGGIRSTFIMAEDITGRKMVELELRRVLREQEIILEAADVGISLVVDRRQVWVNPWVARVFGYPLEELLNHTTRVLYPSQEAYESHGRLAYPALARGEIYETVQELLTRDGRPIWIKYHGKAINPEDMHQGTLWILTDVTGHKAAEDQLRASEARFRTMFESHSAVMLLIDPRDGRIVDANPAAAAFYGYERDRLRAMNIAEINQTPPEQWREELGRAAQSRKKTFIFPHRLADGRIRTVEVNSSSTEVEGRTLLFSIIRDITEHQQTQAALAREREQLEALNQSLEARVLDSVADLREKDQMLISQNRLAAMGEMIGNIAHQWRQPLNALSILMANLRDDYRYGTLEEASMERAFTEGDRLIQRMSSTINDFKNFFRPDKAMAGFSALRQVQSAVALVADALAAQGIRVEIAAPEDPQLFGYPNEYSQVLLNLLGNAREAILSQGVLPGRITIRLRTEDGFGRLEVADNGRGIPPDCLDRIFEPYFSTRASGTGIGLYMSKQIIERSMGGRISARNGEDGAEFTVLVPAAGGAP